MTRKMWWAVLGMTAVALTLFVIGVVRNHSLDYWYLPYNLALAMVPLGLAWLVQRVAQKRATWRMVVLTGVWLLFLPNSFYIVTDFVHVAETARVDMVEDVIMLFQFSLLGMLLGYKSLLMVHQLWLRYVSAPIVALGVALALFLCSFAMYLGRVLRWNSWDVVTNPVGVARDVYQIVTDPSTYANAWWMAFSFMALLGSTYLLVWQISRQLKRASS